MINILRLFSAVLITGSVLALTACKDQAAKDREESIAYHKKVMSYHDPLPPLTGGQRY